MLVPTSCANIYYRFCFTTETCTLEARCGNILYIYIYIGRVEKLSETNEIICCIIEIFIKAVKNVHSSSAGKHPVSNAVELDHEIFLASKCGKIYPAMSD